MPKPMKRPTDVTGRKAELLAEENKEEQQRRAAQMAMMTASAAEERNEIVDLSEEIQRSAGPVEVEIPMRTFRVNSTLENMTYGHGNNFTFEEGRTYKAPAYIYTHLEEKGYIWH